MTNQDYPERPVVSVSAWLDNSEVCQEAIDAAAGLPYTSDVEFEPFYTYLLVDEPIIQLMPWYFLPLGAENKVRSRALRTLAVAAKLENARNRWLDEMVDGHTPFMSLTSPHGLNEAIVGLTRRLYEAVLPHEQAADFFERLATLYARHSLSLVFDGKRLGLLQRPLTLAEYEVQAKARHSSVRAPLDALLTLVGAEEEQYKRATDSWHAWGLGAQLYDDALDVEEDFLRGTLTWTVSRTMECFGGRSPENVDEFYGVCLREGIVAETLMCAEAHFGRAARLARSTFPRWAPIQHGCMRQARTLREDYDRLLKLEPLDH
ncbi:MAG TPA: hypothetical protein VKA73_07860 [Rubrobacter sp.]|nr:hypothetical protein [Rubrobacter sp.]